MTEYLSPSEMHTLSGCARFAPQCNWLMHNGIPHRADGKRIIVSRVHVQSWLEGRTVTSSSGLNLAGIK